MLKRMAFLVVALVVISTVLVGCGESTETASPTQTSGAQVTPTPAPVVWKANTHQARTSTKDYLAFQDLKNRIEEYTDGRVQLELYFMDELVPAADQLDALNQGVIDLAWTYSGYWSGKLPAGLGDIEGGGTLFWLDIWQCYDLFWNWGLDDLLAEQYAKLGVKLLTQSCTNYAWLWTKVPVETLADLQSIKVRSVGAGAAMLEGMGASVTYVPLGELYTALLTGAVDAGTWGGYGADIGGKLHEVVDYVVVDPYIWAGNEHIIVSMDSWNKLSERDQLLVQEAARANAIAAQYIWFEEDARAREVIMEDNPNLTEIHITDPAYLAKRAESREKMLADWETASPEAAQAVAIMKDYFELYGIE